MSHAALHTAPRFFPAQAGMGADLEPPTPAQVRQWVSDLFNQNRISLAVALVEAGLALYPDSEDVLVIAALVAEVQQDWTNARQHLEHLISVQEGDTPAEVWCHLVRVLRCQKDDAAAQNRLQQALLHFPQHSELLALRQEFAEPTSATHPTGPDTGPHTDTTDAGSRRQFSAT